MRATSIQQSGTATTTSARPKPSGSRNSTAPSTSGHRLADQILAGDAEMHAPDCRCTHDLGGGSDIDLDAVDPSSEPR